MLFFRLIVSCDYDDEDELAVSPTTRDSQLMLPNKAVEMIKHQGDYKKEDLKKYTFKENGSHKNVELKESSDGVEATDDSHKLKQTHSQALMNSTLLHSLPKYIFQSDHDRLERVKDIMKDLKGNRNQSSESLSELINNDCEVSEYPIEYYENQQHAIHRHMSIK